MSRYTGSSCHVTLGHHVMPHWVIMSRVTPHWVIVSCHTGSSCHATHHTGLSCNATLGHRVMPHWVIMSRHTGSSCHATHDTHPSWRTSSPPPASCLHLPPKHPTTALPSEIPSDYLRAACPPPPPPPPKHLPAELHFPRNVDTLLPTIQATKGRQGVKTATAQAQEAKYWMAMAGERTTVRARGHTGRPWPGRPEGTG